MLRCNITQPLSGNSLSRRISCVSGIYRPFGGGRAVKICHSGTAMRRDGAEVAAWERVAGHTYAMHHCQRGWEFKARKGKRRERSEMASEPTIRYSMCPDGGHCFCPVKRGRCAYNVSRSADHGTARMSFDQVGIDKAVKCCHNTSRE